MLLREAECLPVCKAFNSGQLVEQNQVIILEVEVNRVQVLLKNSRINDVDPSLLQAHVRDAAKDLEQVFEDILLRVLVKVLDLVAQWQHEFLLLDPNGVGRDGGELGAFGGLPLKIGLSVRSNELNVHQDIVEIDFLLLVVVVPPLVLVDGVAKLFVHVTELGRFGRPALHIVGHEVVLRVLVSRPRAHPRVPPARGTAIVVGQLVQHLERVAAVVAVAAALGAAGGLHV